MARSRFVAEHFRRDGTPKRRWATEAQARDAAYTYGKSYYRCGFCGGFHIGGSYDWKRAD